jgi:hypothetical protein
MQLAGSFRETQTVGCDLESRERFERRQAAAHRASRVTNPHITVRKDRLYSCRISLSMLQS